MNKKRFSKQERQTNKLM